MKDKEPKVSTEVHLIAVRDQLAEQVGKIPKGSSAFPFISVITNELSEGTESLSLGLHGMWRRQEGMIITGLGKSPSADTLIQVYAGIKDEEYRAIAIYEQEDGRPEKALRKQGKQYLSEHRERLAIELIKEMEEKLQELRSPVA